MFFMIDAVDIVSYADDNTPYSVRKSQFSLPDCILENSDSQNVLGVTIDRKLKNMSLTYVIRQAEKFKPFKEFSHIYPKYKNYI